MTLLFLAIYLALVPLVLQIAEISRRLGLPAILTCGISCAAVLYLGSLIPGALGSYSALPVGLTTIALALVVALSVWKFLRNLPEQATVHVDSIVQGDAEKWNGGTIALLVLAVVGFCPLIHYLTQLPSMFLAPSTGMNWDVVSYHLPALAEFMQARSLWSVDGPHQSFSQGYELIAGLSVLFFNSPWGLAAANTAGIILVVAAVTYLSALVTRIIMAPLNLPINRVLVQVVSLALWLCMFPDDIFAVGKNDLFEVATLMAAFAYLLDSISSDPPRVRRILLLTFAAVAYGLSIATKPPALIDLPLFMFMAGVSNSRMTDASDGISTSRLTNASDGASVRRFAFSWKSAVFIILGAILIGGFFEVRNLVVFHGLAAPDLVAETDRMSIIHQWRQHELYNPFDRGGLYAFNGLVAVLLFLFWRQKKAFYSDSVPLLCIVAFCLIGLASFAFMPTSVVVSAGVMNFQDRKIMAVYILTGILVAIFIATKVSRLITVTIKPGALSISAAVLLAIASVFNYSAKQQAQPNLPGYDEVKGLPRTEIYEWVHKLPHPQRIYSAGLRPWGLYGPKLENKVFYDLHSHILEHDGEIRLLAIMRQFHPDLILISVDPHAYTGPPRKPSLVEWLRNQKYFTEVYNDATVSGFKVNADWEVLLKNISVPTDPIRMHG